MVIGTGQTGKGDTGADPTPLAVPGDALHPRVIEAEREEDEEMDAAEELASEVASEVVSEETEDVAAGMAEALAAEVEALTARVSALEGELDWARDAVRHAVRNGARSREIALTLADAGAVDLDAVEPLVVARLEENGDDADIAETVAALRAERPALFRRTVGRSADGDGARGVGLGASALSARVPGKGAVAGAMELADEARGRARDRRALLRYLRARRGMV